jgi:hypothetical protein
MRRALLAVLLVAAAGVAARTARADPTPEVSTNWAGYAALPADPTVPVTFTDVTATWRQPRGRCTAGRASSAAFWVGLGGYDPTSPSLEQLGTSVDCDGASRTPTHYAWWELVPAASVRIPLRIEPGDTITAAVLVQGQRIVFSLKDLTRQTRFSKVVTATQTLDTASAEWIAEAPSTCSSFTRCRVIPLTNFGTVAFTGIATIGNAHPGTLTDPLWRISPIELIANGRADALFGGDVLGPGVGAVPGAVTADGRGFAVAWARNLAP